MGITNPADNWTVVFTTDNASDPDKSFSFRRVITITNHEIVHQLQDGRHSGDRLTGGHNRLKAHDLSDECLMNLGDPVSGAGAMNEEDLFFELSLDQIYQLRDRGGIY